MKIGSIETDDPHFHRCVWAGAHEWRCNGRQACRGTLTITCPEHTLQLEAKQRADVNADIRHIHLCRYSVPAGGTCSTHAWNHVLAGCGRPAESQCPEHEAELRALDAHRVKLLPTEPGVRVPVRDELAAMARCCEALEQIRGDAAALRRAVDYLTSRFG